MKVKAEAKVLRETPRTFYICIKGEKLPKALNQMLGRNVWYARQNATQWKNIVISAAAKLKNDRLLDNFHVAICRHSTHELDYDGLISSLKPCIDALKGIIIQDDRYSMTGPWEAHQSFRPRKEGKMLEIMITERVGSIAVRSSFASLLKDECIAPEIV